MYSPGFTRSWSVGSGQRSYSAVSVFRAACCTGDARVCSVWVALLVIASCLTGRQYSAAHAGRGMALPVVEDCVAEAGVAAVVAVVEQVHPVVVMHHRRVGDHPG